MQRAQGARDERGGIETMHLAADGTRAAGNLEAHNQAVMNLSHQLCVVLFCIIRVFVAFGFRPRYNYDV